MIKWMSEKDCYVVGDKEKIIFETESLIALVGETIEKRYGVEEALKFYHDIQSFSCLHKVAGRKDMV